MKLTRQLKKNMGRGAVVMALAVAAVALVVTGYTHGQTMAPQKSGLTAAVFLAVGAALLVMVLSDRRGKS